MNAKEKAVALVEKFQKEIPDYLYQGVMLNNAAKACALICVDEIIKNDWANVKRNAVWYSVKTEIEKL